MRKDVMIFIKGIQSIDGDSDTVELFTKGRYYKRDNARYLSYEELEEGDTEPTIKTLMSIEGTHRVTIPRSGKRRSQLVVENGQRHQCLYDNRYCDCVMGIQGS